MDALPKWVRDGLGSLVDERPRTVIALIALMLALVFALRFVFTNPNDAVLSLFLFPIVFASMVLGIKAGLATSVAAFALFIAWAEIDDANVGFAGYAVRAMTYFPMALLTGILAMRLREALVESKRAARHFEIGRDLVCTATTDGYFQDLNPRWEEALGWTLDELRSRPYIEFVHPDDVEATMKEAARLGQGNFTASFENRYRTRGGDYRWLSWSAIAEPEENLIYAAARDVTPLKEAERIKNQFFGLISHELRTPLTSIVGYTELLRDFERDNLSERGRGFLDVVERNARRQLRLVGDLLTLVRIQTGRFSIEPAPVDLREVVQASVEEAMPAADRRGVRLEVECEEIPAFVGDAQRLGQVVGNLLSNALKFTDRGGEVKVYLRRDHTGAVIEVADTGIGIPADELERLFDRLYRATSATEREIEGLGLGLSIVKAIVEAHRGKVSVASEPGAGTLVRVELPLTGVASELQERTQSLLGGG